MIIEYEIQGQVKGRTVLCSIDQLAGGIMDYRYMY